VRLERTIWYDTSGTATVFIWWAMTTMM